MPYVSDYVCPHCELSLPTGWGGFNYVTDDRGRRIPCPHPIEIDAIKKVTGMGWLEARAAGRLGFVSHCLCFDCSRQFDLDLGRDVKRCPECGSLAVRPANGSIGCTCPSCGVGRIEVMETGGFA
jgi:hypothetical protein